MYTITYYSGTWVNDHMYRVIAYIAVSRESPKKLTHTLYYLTVNNRPTVSYTYSRGKSFL